VKVTNGLGHKITYEYDNTGNLVKVTEPKGNETTEDPDDYVTTYTYDLNHQLTKVTDAKGHSVEYTYDHDGNRTTVKDKEGTVTTTVYDERGLVKEVRVPHDDGVERITRFEYDEVGNRTKVITPRGTETTTAYDALNRVKEQTLPYDPESSDPRDKMTYEYDAVGNLIKVSAPPSAGQSVRVETTYTYFDNGWVKSSTDPWDITTTYDYNELGLQTSRTLTSAGGSSSRTMGWSYYPDGKLKAIRRRRAGGQGRRPGGQQR